MSQPQATTRESPKHGRDWIASMVVSSILATLGLALAAVTCKVALVDGYEGPRSISGILLMAVGFLGPLGPLLLVVKRRRLQRVALAAVPGVHLLLLLGALILGGVWWRFPPLLPYTTSLVLKFGPHDGQKSELLHCYVMPPRSGTQRSDSFEYTFNDASGEIRNVVILKGKVTRAAGHQVQFAGLLTLGEKIRLRVDGLQDISITAGAQTGSGPVDLEPGSYAIVIKGRSE